MSEKCIQISDINLRRIKMEKQYFISKEQFETAKATWKSNQKTHSAWHHIIYNILRSKDIRNGFCEKTKNIQGNDSWFGFNDSLRTARWYCDPKRNPDLFKKHFGIDIPDGLIDRLRNS